MAARTTVGCRFTQAAHLDIVGLVQTDHHIWTSAAASLLITVASPARTVILGHDLAAGPSWRSDADYS